MRMQAVLLVAFVGLMRLAGGPQAPQDSGPLTPAIAQIRSGDFYRAVITLNDAIEMLSRDNDQKTLARAYVYQTAAFIGLEQLVRADGAARLALEADPDIAIDPAEFGARVAALFESVRQPSAANLESSAQAAELGGRYPDAFLAYVNAYRALPQPTAAADDRRLRERIITVAGKLPSPPILPQDARDHLQKANDLIASGRAANALADLREAIRIAPWWPDPIYKLATVQQGAGNIDEALANLSLYRLATQPSNPTPPSALPSPAVAAAGPSVSSTRVAPASILLYWLPTSRSLGMKPTVECDGQRVADVAAGRYIVFTTTPGLHALKFGHAEFSGRFQAGEDNYVRAEGPPARITMTLVGLHEGQAEIQLRGIGANDPKRMYSAQCN